jgi:hypothetical protein
LILIQVCFFFLLLVPAIAIFQSLGFDRGEVALLIVIFPALPSFPVARLILGYLNHNLLSKADENATRRVSEKR